MNKVANLSKQERRELFSETASRMGTTNAIVEKDFWVVWTLDKIFSHPKLREMLMFKGGTSLSKIYGLIERFSEDIDLILDWDLIKQENPWKERSKTQQSKYNEAIKEEAHEYIKKELLPIISELVHPFCTCKIAEKVESPIEIQYPSEFEDRALLPFILLEIGPLASWFPSTEFEISPYAAKEFPELFEKPKCKVKAVLAKRTFWEKATILHQEANRKPESNMPPRYSRHYYDLAMMANSEVKDRALKDLTLLNSVIEFNTKFYPCNWAKFDEAKPGTLKLVPPEFRYKELMADYRAMKNMIFGEYIEFNKIIEILTKLEEEINSPEMVSFETAYLLNNRANRLHLEESIAQMEAGQASERELVEEE